MRDRSDQAGESVFSMGITFHNNRNIFVADQWNHRIQIFTGEGQYVDSFGWNGNLGS